MPPTVRRRAVLAGGLAALAGCSSGASDGGRQSLAPTLTKVSRHPEGWLLSTVVEATADRGGAAFHDATLIGYAADGRQVCSRPIGDVRMPGGLRTVRVSAICSGFPSAVTFDAAESPCDPGTTIRVAVADRRPEGTAVEEHEPVAWSVRDRRCGEGLPPNVTPGRTPPG